MGYWHFQICSLLFVEFFKVYTTGLAGCSLISREQHIFSLYISFTLRFPTLSRRRFCNIYLQLSVVDCQKRRAYHYKTVHGLPVLKNEEKFLRIKDYLHWAHFFTNIRFHKRHRFTYALGKELR